MDKQSNMKFLFYLRVYLLIICVNGVEFEKVHFNRFLSIPYNLQENKMYIFQTFLEISIQNCVKECKLTRVCSFIHFHVKTSTCKLIKSSTDAVIPSKLPGYVFGMKSDWNMSSLNLCASCADDERCDPDTPTLVCEINACGKPEVANGTFLIGNMYSIDNKLQYACATGYTSTGSSAITCHLNGSWSSLNTCTEDINLCPLTSDYQETTLSDGSRFSYWLVEVKYTQAEALDFCMSCQGKLVKVLSHPKMNFLRNLLMNKADGIGYWVDASNSNAADYFSNDAWTTSSGETVPISSVLWSPGKPDDPGNDHCARMKSEENYYLDDYYCTGEFYVICEK